MLKYSRPESESVISPTGELEQVTGAMFGSSLACLGNSDSGDVTKMVVVGAPYYNQHGAVFIYR